ncbi:hypothetical protein ABZW18_02185 [Streptomyces sp. NPDC004647]|uniref:hypothetical protein n=1 Tax=Streptomyces sp. NPDC004647 TaxID=3154671 RepID=UPI0033A350E2
MFGGVYGTVQASALLAALQGEGSRYTPAYDALWVLVTAVTSALAHGYARHMSTFRPDSTERRLRRVGHSLIGEWPLVAASLPTVLLLSIAGLAGWPEPPVSTIGLGINAALLFGWGMLGALHMGYRRPVAILGGAADCALGLLIAATNALIK